jgi:hypothetical protein
VANRFDEAGRGVDGDLNRARIFFLIIRMRIARFYKEVAPIFMFRFITLNSSFEYLLSKECRNFPE